MSDVLTYLIFILTAAIPLIAIIGELHHSTPNSVAYSIVRSIICMGSLFFMSAVLNPAYHASISHLAIVALIFVISCIQLSLELRDTSIDEIIKEHHTKRHR